MLANTASNTGQIRNGFEVNEIQPELPGTALYMQLLSLGFRSEVVYIFKSSEVKCNISGKVVRDKIYKFVHFRLMLWQDIATYLPWVCMK